MAYCSCRAVKAVGRISRERLLYSTLLYAALVATDAIGQTTNIYTGGVNGFSAMIDPSNSITYRHKHGGLYLHNNGWSELSHEQRLNLLTTFTNSPITIEVGFPKPGEFGFSPDLTKYHWWCDNFRDLYVKYGIVPNIVAVNIEDTINNPGLSRPTYDQFKRHHDDLKSMSPRSLVLPIIGPMNVEMPIVTEPVSCNMRYQSIINLAGGVVIDCPPKVFIYRETHYKQWVMDAIQYVNSKGLKTVLIISPHDSSTQFKNHTVQMLRYLEAHRALPAVYVVENYIYGKGYYNKVGKESQSNSILGVAKFIQGKLN